MKKIVLLVSVALLLSIFHAPVSRTWDVSPVSPLPMPKRHFADIDGNGVVNIADICIVAYRWNCRCGEACYAEAYDFHGDCTISIADVQVMACYFGWPNGDFSRCWKPE